MGRSRYKITDPKLPHFVTCTVLHWIPVFTRPATVGIVLDSLHYLIANSLRVYAYVILENHLHLILEQLAFYKKAHKHDRAYPFWQEGRHPEWIQNDEMMR